MRRGRRQLAHLADAEHKPVTTVSAQQREHTHALHLGRIASDWFPCVPVDENLIGDAALEPFPNRTIQTRAQQQGQSGTELLLIGYALPLAMDPLQQVTIHELELIHYL